MFNEIQNRALAAPLNAKNVKRNPKGFDYIEGWRAIDEANRIFGFDAWDRETLETHQLGEPEQDAKGNWRVAYRCRVRITVRADGKTIVRDGSGYGSGIVKDIRDAHEGAIKEAETDAMKRALMTFGNPFGLALYDKEQANVVDDDDEQFTRDKAAFIRSTETLIDTHPTSKALLDWWNSEDQKKARRDYELNAAELEDLKNKVVARKKTLDVKEAA